MDGECINCGETGNWCECSEEELPSSPIVNFGHEWFDGGTWHQCVNCGCTDQELAATCPCPMMKSRHLAKSDA